MSLATPRKGYKSVPWLFGKDIEIPQEWELEPLEKFSNITMGMSPPSESYNENQEGLPFYQGITDFGENYPNTTMWCSDPKKIAEKDQILFSVRAPVGETNITNEQSCLGRGVCSINPLDNELMYCYFLISYFKKQFVVYAQGTTYDAINRNEIARTKLPFTSNKNEQQKIATILSNVDNLIESTGKVITHSKKVKTGLMQKLLTRGIGHVAFKKVPWYFGKEIEIPEEWKITTLKENSYVTDGSHLSPPKVTKGFPMATVENVRDSSLDIDSCYKISEEDFEQLIKNNCKPEINDVLFTKDGTVGKSLVFTQDVDVVILSSIAILKPFESLDSYFLHYSFHSEAITKFIAKFLGGTAIKRIVLKNLEKFYFPLPPLPEQQKIATILSNVDSKITSQEQYKEKLEKLKKSLMQKLLTGEVRV